MLALNRKQSAIYWIGIFVILAAISALGMTGVFSGMSMNYVVVLLIITAGLLWGRSCHKRAKNDYNRMIALLNDRCDPEGFMAAQKSMYRRACRRKRIRGNVGWCAAIVRINRAVALAFAGQHQQAIIELENLLALPISIRKEYISALCHIDLAQFRLLCNEDGDIETACEHIETARRFAGADRENGHALSGELTRVQFCLDIARGNNLQEALEYFGKIEENEIFMRGRVSARYQQALAYEKLGDSEKMREELEFIAQNAPKAYIGKQAAQRLEELSAQ